MNIDINEMFSEKNQNLFLNKLVLDLDNNTDTFKLAAKHIVMIEIAKLLSSLKKVYTKYSVTTDESKIKDLLNGAKSGLLENINIVISDKCDINKKYIEEEHPKTLDRSYLKKYHRHIDDSETTFESSVNLGVKEEMVVKLYNSLIGLYPCVNEQMHFDLVQAVNVDFTNNVINRIIEESKHRNMTLKNMSEETYKKYLELSRSSDVISKSKKVKVKKDD